MCNTVEAANIDARLYAAEMCLRDLYATTPLDKREIAELAANRLLELEKLKKQNALLQEQIKRMFELISELEKRPKTRLVPYYDDDKPIGRPYHDD